ncbi:hypothetical protein ACFFGR_09495 [Arthrobacter liuii]|uniref:Uncharacterized protein n=1 Tax=Arthrobacter liuii TaxID=1476996 RepID=A0ABQ2APZ0_9MICC|nr:hypothetical protein [Arthrobacter liuii]GGH93943.1 hypothetical protein GCM10007170_15990 [Arthrobacter liuii]
MSIRKTTERHARAVILSQCRQFTEDTPWDEPGHEWDERAERLAKYLDNELGTDISAKAMGDLRELLTTLEEIQSVDAGTHHRIDTRYNNQADLRDELANTLHDNVTEVLSVGAFKAIQEGRAA